MSCIELLRGWGFRVDDETRLSIGELMEAAHSGRLEEVFGTGTAAVISPVGQLCYGGDTVSINGNAIGPVTQKLYDTLTGIQYGRLPDDHNWVVTV